MILKIGIQNAEDSTVTVRTFDNITVMEENEPHEHDGKRKERLIHFLRPSLEGYVGEDLAFNIDWNDDILFAYLMNDNGKTFKVLKHDQRLWNRNVHGEKLTDTEADQTN